MDQKPTINHDAHVEALSRRLYGGAVTVGVISLRVQHSDGELTLRGHSVSSALQVDPLDLNAQSSETILVDPDVVVHRGSTSRIRLVFKPAATGMAAVLDISLSGVHFDNLLEEVKRREVSEAELPRRNHAADLTITGHLAVKSLGDVAFAEALAEDLRIFGWREEFGYDSDGMWAKPDDGKPAHAEDAGPPEIVRQTNLAEILRKNMEEPKAPATPPVCPTCNKPMVRRRAYQGPNAGNDFWGCSGYPDCRGTRSLNATK